MARSKSALLALLIGVAVWYRWQPALALPARLLVRRGALPSPAQSKLPDFAEQHVRLASAAALTELQRRDSVGALVVHATESRLFQAAVSGLQGWAVQDWRGRTLYEPETPSCFDDPSDAGHVLHAVHVAWRGAAALGAIYAGKEGRLEAMCHMDDVELDNIVGSVGLGGEDAFVLRRLRDHCRWRLDVAGALDARWVPGLRPGSLVCSRQWRARSYRAWHAWAAAQPAPRFTFTELFAGVGGFRLGLEALGGRCVFACEIMKSVRSTYASNFPGPEPLGDVKSIDTRDIPSFDILTAGFPCQSYTTYNPTARGLDCELGQLIYDVVRFLREKQPAAALLENVEGLRTHRGGADFFAILAALRGAGYAVDWRSIDARKFVPQQRVRVYIVCIREDLRCPKGILSTSRGCMPAGTLDEKPDALGRDTTIEWPDIPANLWKAGAISTHSLSDILEAPGAVADTHALTEKQWAQVAEHEGSIDKASKTRLLWPHAWCCTLTSSYRSDWKYASQFVVRPNSTPRFLTPRECARLMGFPDSFKIRDDTVAYKQLGNAVVPDVITAIATRILQAIGK